GGVGDLPARLLDRLAHLGGHRDGELLLTLEHQVGPPLEKRRALERGRPAPGLERLERDVRGAARLVRAAVGDLRDDLAGGGVPHLEGGRRALPLPAQVPATDVLDGAHGSSYGLQLRRTGARRPGPRRARSTAPTARSGRRPGPAGAQA